MQGQVSETPIVPNVRAATSQDAAYLPRAVVFQAPSLAALAWLGRQTLPGNTFQIHRPRRTHTTTPDHGRVPRLPLGE